MADETGTLLLDAARAADLGLPFPLTEAERALITGSRRGTPAGPALDEDGGTKATGDAVRPVVRAAVIAALCTSVELDVHARGVQLRGSRLAGELDLRETTLRVPLTLVDCALPDRVVLADATLPSLTLRRCHIDMTFAAARLHVDGCVDLSASHFALGVELYDADIGGDLLCADVVIRSPKRANAIAAAGVRIGADLALMGASISGNTSLSQATVGRSIYCNGAELRNPDDVALAFDGGHAASIVMLPGPRPSTRVTQEELHPLTCVGAVDMSGSHIGSIAAMGVQIEGAPLALSLLGAQVERSVDLRTFAIHSGKAAGTHTRPDVLHRTQLRGCLDLAASTIGGDLLLDGASLIGRPAINGGAMRLAGTLSLRVVVDDKLEPVRTVDGRPLRFEAHGMVDLADAQLAWLYAPGAALRASSEEALVVPHGDGDDQEIALNLWGATIAKDVDLGTFVGPRCYARSELAGQLWLESATIGRNLVLDGLAIAPVAAAQESAMAATVIYGRRLEVRGLARLGVPTDAHNRLLLDDSGRPVRFAATGSILVTEATLGALDLIGAHIEAGAGVALGLRGIDVVRDIRLLALAARIAQHGSDSTMVLVCKIKGQTDLSDARIGGTLDGTGASLTVASDTALQAGGASFGAVRLARATRGREPLNLEDGTAVRFAATGVVDFTNATVRQTLTCRGGRFRRAASGDGAALKLYGVNVGGDLILAATVVPPGSTEAATRFEADGIHLVGARIAGHLTLADGRVTAPPTAAAIDAQSANIGGHLILDRLDCTGAINLRSVSADTLTYHGGTLEPRPPDGTKVHSGTPALLLDAAGLRLSGPLEWRPDGVGGRVSLRAAKVDEIKDDPARWPGVNGWAGSSELDGLTYTAIAPTDSWKVRRAWLAAQPEPLGQPYLQLASVYRAAGDDRAARKISMERFNIRLRRRHGRGDALERAWRWILRAFIGHGYEPWRILPWLAATWLVVWLVVAVAASSRHMVPTAAGVNTKPAPTDCRRRDYACLEPALFAIDDVVPVIDLGQTSAWHATGSLGYVLTPAIGRFIGWFFTTLVLAGLTGIIRRE